MSPCVIRYDVEGWGVGELWLDDDRPVWHELPRPGAVADGVAHPLVDLVRAYFAGEEVEPAEARIELDHETPFGRELALALRRVPRGEVVTYGELAALAGRPGAARAAGTFCARNPLPLFVPCHRVVASGGLGGYGSLGGAYKQRLLDLERVAL